MKQLKEVISRKLINKIRLTCIKFHFHHHVTKIFKNNSRTFVFNAYKVYFTCLKLDITLVICIKQIRIAIWWWPHAALSIYVLISIYCNRENIC